jgi:predicted TIM-barrel fold metal-dependent hydrolase
MNFKRRRLVAAGLAGSGFAGLAGLAAWRWWPEQGVLNPCLGALPPDLANHTLVREAWAGIDPANVWDTHAHLLSTGIHGGKNDGDDGGGIDGARGTLAWPLVAAQRYFFRNAACIREDDADPAYITRLRALADAMPAGHTLLLLALDRWHDEAGRALPERTHAWVGNDYCAAVARSAPERFAWAASVHPYRTDALAELERVRRLGARAVKWIPSAQGIDPGSPRCDGFYTALARLDLPLISHAGTERAAPGDDALGNPLHLRRALEHGVRVVVAHCASMGENRDLDRGAAGAMAHNFALFERMMDEPAHVGRLYGDLSALTQAARAGAPLRRILERAGTGASGNDAGGEWAGRLLNGSDYPVPAIMPLYSPRDLAQTGLLDPAAVAPLTAIRRHNALLFDFVLKRQLRSGSRRLPQAVFETRRFFTGTP